MPVFVVMMTAGIGGHFPDAAEEFAGFDLAVEIAPDLQVLIGRDDIIEVDADCFGICPSTGINADDIDAIKIIVNDLIVLRCTGKLGVVFVNICLMMGDKLLQIRVIGLGRHNGKMFGLRKQAD